MRKREYPDISDILARKEAGRRQRAALSFSEKLDIVDALRERVRPIIEARKAREEIRRQGALLAQHPENAEIDAWIEQMHDGSEWR
jgi:hypothetical protein